MRGRKRHADARWRKMRGNFPETHKDVDVHGGKKTNKQTNAWKLAGKRAPFFSLQMEGITTLITLGKGHDQKFVKYNVVFKYP